ncbi:MAG TPA: holo-ACP synthase [Spirochaetota bacterium]|nr:holo-ACP synthase [Spirochaetota bacterium]HPU87477.1 holo-ACP synthase [Spirochaetota bacterium]
MILGIGTDIVSIERIAELRRRHADRFVRRILSEAEVSIMPGAGADAFLAGRFAAKEAFVKAIGGRAGIAFADIAILNDDAGKPALVASGRIAAALPDGAARTHVSISHEREFATAVVIIETG